MNAPDMRNAVLRHSQEQHPASGSERTSRPSQRQRPASRRIRYQAISRHGSSRMRQFATRGPRHLHPGLSYGRVSRPRQREGPASRRIRYQAPLFSCGPSRTPQPASLGPTHQSASSRLRQQLVYRHSRQQSAYMHGPYQKRAAHSRQRSHLKSALPKSHRPGSRARRKWSYKQLFTKPTQPPDQWTSTKQGPIPSRTPHIGSAIPCKQKPPIKCDPSLPYKKLPQQVRCISSSKRKLPILWNISSHTCYNEPYLEYFHWISSYIG